MITERYISIDTAIKLTTSQLKVIISMVDICKGNEWVVNANTYKEMEKRFQITRTFFQYSLKELVEKKIIQRKKRGTYVLSESILVSGNFKN